MDVLGISFFPFMHMSYFLKVIIIFYYYYKLYKNKTALTVTIKQDGS